MAIDGCCDVMEAQLNLSCPDHADLSECPDALVVRVRAGHFRMPFRDGGSSFSVIEFCPWCGRNLAGL